MSTITIARLRAAILAAAPAVMLAGLFYHPHIGNPTDADFLTRLGVAVVADPLRWAIAHLAVAVASGLVVLAFLALRGRVREAGEERWSALALPFIVMGSTLYAMLPAMEFAPLATARTGADIETIAATQGALFVWFIPTLFTAALLFLVGAAGFAVAVVRSRILDPRAAWIVATALVVTAASRFAPISAIQLYLHSVAGLVAFWPVAYVVAREPQIRRPREERRPTAPASAVSP